MIKEANIMADKKTLQDYQKEFASEIDDVVITVEMLKKVGVSEKILSGEIALRKLYGDEIVQTKERDVFEDNEQKKVEKINLADLKKDEQLRQIWAKIDASEFDDNLNRIV